MSLLKRLKAKVNPKARIKAEFMKRLPHIKDDLYLMLDDLFMQVAEQNKCNPFELVLILHKKDKLAIGSFFSANQKEVSKIDAGALIQELFMRQLSVIPEALREAVFSELGTNNVSSMILKALKGKRLLIRYDENDEFSFVEVTKSGSETIDINDFLNTLDF
jgi:hypothetical protein